MLRAGARFCQSARAASASRFVGSKADAAFPLVDPLPNTVQVGLETPPTQRQLVEFTNGIFVGATTSSAPTATVNIVVRAGSRYESSDEVGISHYLRRLAYKSTDKHTAVYMTCVPQWYGMKLSCTGTRDSIIYSGTCLKDDVDYLLDVMCQTVTAPKMYNWEVRYTPYLHERHTPRLEDAYKRVTEDTNSLALDRTIRLMDTIQNTAFRGGLGQSPYCPAHRVGGINEDACVAFHKRRYVGANMGVFAAGVHPDDLVTAVTRHGLYNVPKGEPVSAQAEGVSKYCSANAEIRHEGNESTVIAALVGQGVGLTSDQHVSSLLLQRILGSEAPMESGYNLTRLQSAAEKASAGRPTSAQSFNFNYSDNGLFGVQVEAQRDDARNVVKAVAGEFTRASAGITEKELTAAKVQLVADLLIAQETQAGVLEDMAYQCLYRGGKYLVPEKVAERVEAVTLKEVKEFAQTVLKSKIILGQSGDLRNAVHIDELGL